MKKIISLITILIAWLGITVNLNALMAGNEGEGAYGSNGRNSGGSAAAAAIGELIVKGGGFLFQSSADINIFFNKIELAELSGPDYEALQTSLNAAIDHMEQARTTYLQLKTLAVVTPYNQEVIYKLINFDYDAFQQENRLFPFVFARVKDFLSVGNVTGIFNEFYSYTGQILDLLYTLKREVDAEIFPTLSTVWRVNQQYSGFKLFGQYVTRVFYRIKL
ncbi:MAG: hypothetical protein GTO45_35135 [Candidatus Aminicenantes bacterium]|nr:hypothetical protein [Candidatus Aminicenantes bacterium]NIM83923.1 hypothetical protein [Candidatus Aminicenantes bacterium]NIN23392.1 hypothetical protein [Candidatus Aminicenantes bacterium]NIN47094.1 hypothetical protein [Candidatus Aminicenantes bacterium]NIN90018.1 hypothetical protein [Candidatus Aminicenantes bacterium]